MASLIQTLQHVLESHDPRLPVETQRILLKQVLQAYVLDFLYNHATYRRLNFYGGTCLHVVYALNRLSEDLDFDNGGEVDLSHLADDLRGLFQKTLGYDPAEVGHQQAGNGILRATIRLPVLNALALSPHANAALHLKVEISHHKQTAVLHNTPVFYLGRSFVPSHFSIETMMAGKMIACLERNFQRGRQGAFIKGRDYYDLLWFMQKHIQPLEEKLAKDGDKPHTTQSAMLALKARIAGISSADLAVDLLPMFESRAFVEAWVGSFHENFERYSADYVKE